jgi:hypothetical protein
MFEKAVTIYPTFSQALGELVCSNEVGQDGQSGEDLRIAARRPRRMTRSAHGN